MSKEVRATKVDGFENILILNKIVFEMNDYR